MAMSKKDLEKKYKDTKIEIAALETKCQGGSGTKEDYILLTKLKKKMK